MPTVLKLALETAFTIAGEHAFDAIFGSDTDDKLTNLINNI